MSSDRPNLARPAPRLLLLALAALASPACMSQRQGPKPPSFPGGGLLAVGAPLPVFLPDGTTPVLKALDGVYDTSSRFGNGVVVHSSLWGDLGANVKASLAILANDHFAFALLQGGCLDAAGTGPGTDTLVFEGYWRYLDDPDPTPAITGLVRLFVQPASVARQFCEGQTAVAPGTATLVGATGNGNNAPGLPLQIDYRRARKSKNGPEGQRFGVGMHHGGCVTSLNCGVSENTPETLVFAKQLGADYLEIDAHLTADGIPVSIHLGLTPDVVQGVYCTGSVEDYTYAQLVANCRLRNGEIIPRLVDMLEYGLRRTDLPFYIDMKSPDVIVPTSAVIGDLSQRLVDCSVTTPPPGGACLFPGSKPVTSRAVIGLPASDYVSAYRDAQAGGQLAPGQRCLVEVDPNDVIDVPCVAWMPRYTRGPMTSDVQRLQSLGKVVGYWTINDPKTMDEFLVKAVPNAILTNYIGFLNQRWEEVGILPQYPVAP
ncbi:MAG TPA: glycerophosphodiester phosphodiesterase family protein [Anaeromyxobacteraceae bacterium]|nr:glycerophosphodiester phosphodiesterase family protein [Anaeromyxobacteraceae bacterium]